MRALDTLNTLVSSIIARLWIDENSIDAVLTNRDAPFFSAKWIRAFDALEAEKRRSAIHSADAAAITKTREQAYLQAFARWKSDDIAAYISDDFGLIADALIAGVDDPWINALLYEYMNGRVPTGQLNEQRLSLEEQLRNANSGQKRG